MGAITGLFNMLSMALQGSTNVAVVGNILVDVFLFPKWVAYVAWIVSYTTFVIINLKEVRFFRVTFIMNLYCCSVLVCYIGCMLWNLPSQGDVTSIIVDGKAPSTQLPSVINIIHTLPYALWWFAGIEVRAFRTMQCGHR
jgi:hypothetical protein